MASVDDNIPEYSVSELAQGVRRTLETAFARVRVRGEISGFKQYASGHGYFSLKDMDAAISAVIWRARLAGLSFQPEDGLEVVAIGRVSAYPKNSRFQLVVEHMEVAGVGALLRQIEERRQRLLAEGLFEPATKPRPPFIPKHIGVITSPQGAVIRDILHRLNDRFPRRVTLWPAPVQGTDAARRITAGIRGFNAMPEGERPDLLIVARGGGSIEDLMPFNDEELVRAAAASRIPLISAVGHETDTMLIDYAAALRAPTPSAAAELAVPVRAELLATLADLDARRERARRRAISLRHERLQALAARLPRPTTLLGMAGQRLDDAGARLALAVDQKLRGGRTSVVALAARLPHPRGLLLGARQRLAAAGERSTVAVRQRLRLLNGRLETSHLRPALLVARLRGLRALLEARMRLVEGLSPKAVMARGYALVHDASDGLVTSASAARQQVRLLLQFADGAVPVLPENAAHRPHDKGSGPVVPTQGNLW